MALSVIKYQCSWLMSLLYVFDPAKLIGHQFEFLIEQLNLFVNCLIFKLSNLCLVRSCKGKGGEGEGSGLLFGQQLPMDIQMKEPYLIRKMHCSKTIVKFRLFYLKHPYHTFFIYYWCFLPQLLCKMHYLSSLWRGT